MTTKDNTEKKDRTIDELLQETTYQGMSDSEITTILNHVVKMVETNVRNSVYVEALTEYNKQQEALNKQIAKNADEKLQKLLDKGNKLLTIDTEGNVNEKQ
ncbi:MAG: hypothetical protein K2G60_06715 [Oscillospiraceae bacterium]|nr:hypothetical protein [Oscillospiraceae bacterium]